MVTVPFAAPPFVPTRLQVLPPSPLGVSLPDTLPDTGVSSVVVEVAIIVAVIAFSM